MTGPVSLCLQDRQFSPPPRVLPPLTLSFSRPRPRRFVFLLIAPRGKAGMRRCLPAAGKGLQQGGLGGMGSSLCWGGGSILIRETSTSSGGSRGRRGRIGMGGTGRVLSTFKGLGRGAGAGQLPR